MTTVQDRADSDARVLERLAAGRATCRAYRPEPVPQEVVRSILAIAGRTASWCNVQPWHMVVASPEATENFRRALMAHAATAPAVASDLPFPDEYTGIHGERRREAGLQLYAALGIGRGDDERRAAQGFENFRLFGAPQVAIVTMPADLGPYAAVDCGGFIASFLLAAHAHGVATTPQAALARHARFVRSHFGIGDDRRMVCGISFGYADTGHPANGFRTRRAPLHEVARFV